MAIYNVNGTELFSAYDVNGNTLSNAYDVNGNLIFTGSGTVRFRVMSYNIQKFTNLNSDVTIQNEAFATQAPDIVGMQEMTQRSSYPTIGGIPANTYLRKKGFTYVNMASTVSNKVAIATKYPTTDFEETLYTNHGSEVRGYTKCYVSIGGKQVAFYNTHLEPYHGGTQLAIRSSQIQQLLTDIANEETFILTGDLNTDLCFDMTGTDYINVIKPMIDAGYNVANCNPNGDGFMPTWSDSTDFTTNLYNLDNIVTSSDITMVDVWRDMYKISHNPNEYAIDHIPLLADLEITL